MSHKPKGLSTAISVLILILQLVLLYFIKYKNQQLTLNDFSLQNTGNIINLIFILAIVLGLIIYRFRKSASLSMSVIYIFLIITSFLLIICLLTLYIKLPSSEIYIFEQNLNKFIVGFIFSLYQLFLIILLSYLWLRLFSGKNLILLRVLFNTIVIIIVLLLFAYFYIDVKMNSFTESLNKTNKPGIAVVLGAAVWSNNQPSPTLASRLDKAAKLYEKGFVNKIQLTGSNAPGEMSEAEVAFKYILDKGVDTSDIYIERRTTSTSEQIKFIKYTIVPSGMFKNILVVSDNYHLVRVDEISRFYNLKVNVSPSELRLGFYNILYNKIRESIGLIIFWCFAL